MFKKVWSLVLVLALAMVALPAAAEPAFAPIAAEDIKVGAVFIGPKDDGFSGAHYNGIEGMKEALGLKDEQILYKFNVAENSECENALRELVEAGCSIIFGNSWGYMNYMEEIAEEYPDVVFSHCSGYKNNGVNFNNYFGRIYQARYLTGIVAGLTTKTNQIGYVAAYPIPEVVRGINAFTLGVRSVNPDAVVHVRWSGSWNNIGREISTTEKLLKDMPIDVLTQHQNTTHPMEVADRYGIKVIGYNTDRQADFPDIFLTAPVWNWAPFCKQRLNECFEGRFEGKAYFESMNGGMLGIAPLSPLVPPEAAAPIQTAEKRLRTQTWDVFYGPIYDQQGRLRVERGENISDHELLQHFDWFVQGVEGTL